MCPSINNPHPIRKAKLINWIIVLTLLYIIFLFIILPFGEFLSDDDWAYVKSVEYLYKHGQLKILDWNPMSLIFHTFVGYIFSKIFGFSFTILRISTLILGLVGNILFYLLLKELGINEIRARLFTLLLIFNPIYFFLLFTFMTDVPFITWMIASMLFYLKGLKSNKIIYLYLGSLFATFCFLIRQSGILIPIGVFLYCCIHRSNYINLLKQTMAIICIPFLSFVIFE